MWKRTTVFMLIATSMLLSLSVFADDVGVNANIEPEYAMYAGLSPPVDATVGYAVNYNNAYKIAMNSSIEPVHLKLEKRKPDEMNFNQSVIKVSNEAKMQNQNFDRVSYSHRI